jgi:hypothetical protein
MRGGFIYFKGSRPLGFWHKLEQQISYRLICYLFRIFGFMFFSLSLWNKCLPLESLQQKQKNKTKQKTKSTKQMWNKSKSK